MRSSTPIKYFGQRESLLKDLFSIFPRHKFKSFFDPFSGSASITIEAAEHKKADRYVVNDSLPFLKFFWDQVRDDSKGVIAEYNKLYEDYRDGEQDVRQAKYSKYQGDFNRLRLSAEKADRNKAAVYFVFLMNYAENNMPLFDAKGNLEAKPDVALKLTDELDSSFVASVKHVSALFNDSELKACEGGFADCLESATHEDFVMFDPPYPDMQKQGVYFHLEQSDIDLQNKLKASFKELNSKKVPFVALYGAGPVESKDQFLNKDLDLTCLVRLSYHPLYKDFLEYIYLSPCVPVPAKLPAGIVLYEDLFKKDVSYNQALQTLMQAKAQSSMTARKTTRGILFATTGVVAALVGLGIFSRPQCAPLEGAGLHMKPKQ